ncbi:MAG: hypothetical protein V1890_00195 [Candidatus Zixiibacteriota bacterium]
MEKDNKLFLDGIRSLKSKDFKLAEQKFRDTLTKKGSKSKKAELIYQALLIRKECEKLIQDLKFRF